MPDSILDWGIDLILSLQASFGWADGILNAFSFLGSENFFLIFFTILIWCVDMTMGFRTYLFLSINIYVNAVFKVVFHDPRPYWYDARVKLLGKPEFIFGVPSGHSQNSVVLWGSLANLIKKTWAWIVAVLLMLFIGYSRIQLGLHFPTDVFIGWAFGIIMLILMLQLEKPVTKWFSRYSPTLQITILFGTSLLLIALGSTIISSIGSANEIPPEWVQNVLNLEADAPIDPYHLRDITTTVSSIFGGMAGFIWLQQRGGMNAGGPLTKRVLRYIVGIIIAVVLWQGLDIVFSLLAEDNSFLGLALRFVRYSTVGLWIGGFGPMVFRRLNLAEALE